MKSYQKYARRTAALLLACGVLTAQAWAAKITPSTTAVTLRSGEQTFTVDVKLAEDNAFAGAEFGLDLPEGVTLTKVEFLDPSVQNANHSPEVTVDGRTYFGFYTAENTFSGNISVARLTFTYTGETNTSFSLGSSKVVTVQEDGSTKGDTSSEPFTVQITRKSSSSGGSSSSGTSTSTGLDSSSVSNPFTDLDGHWGKDAILAAVNDGLFSGTSATTF
ncbi:MAG: cohesin domain-containing protein, partial [Butyricicoccus sp.]